MFYLPAGLYTIGDPCYFFNENRDGYDEFLLQNNFPGEGFLDKNEKNPVVVLRTLHGDGEYFDNDSNEYGVDSGSIGIFPYNEGEAIPDGHVAFSFEERFACHEKNGILTFGNVTIDTSEESYIEEESEEYDEW